MYLWNATLKHLLVCFCWDLKSRQVLLCFVHTATWHEATEKRSFLDLPSNVTKQGLSISCWFWRRKKENQSFFVSNQQEGVEKVNFFSKLGSVLYPTEGGFCLFETYSTIMTTCYGVEIVISKNFLQFVKGNSLLTWHESTMELFANKVTKHLILGLFKMLIFLANAHEKPY